MEAALRCHLSDSGSSAQSSHGDSVVTVWVAVGLCGVPWNMKSERAQKRNRACEFLGKSNFYLVTTVKGQHDRI